MSISQSNIKKLSILIIVQVLLMMPVFAIDLDYSVDDTIRKNYNPNVKIVPKQVKPKSQTPYIPVKQTNLTEDKMPTLPALPKSVQKNGTYVYHNPPVTTYAKPYQTQEPIKYRTVRYQNPKYHTPNYKTQVATYNKNTKIQPIRKGMVFVVENVGTITDRQRPGTKIIFRTIRPIRMVYYTIPENTELVGYITHSHSPQLSANGGLLSIKLAYINLEGKYQRINAKVIKANDKKIFFNNIKGRRLFWKYTCKKGKWGRTCFHKMNQVTLSMAKDKTTVILSPFTFIYGTALLGISTITSPALALLTKGGEIGFPPNSYFYIKFMEDSNLYY